MTDTMSWSWAGLLALGAFHGVNPGMGWLFAVALGMQERRRAAVCRAMLPLALGHGLAIAAAIGVAVLAGAIVPLKTIQWIVAGLLLVLGLSRLFRHGHPRWVGMHVSMRDLTVWSFLMASAHGAGLMVLPLVLGTAVAAAPHCAAHAAGSGTSSLVWATIVHSGGYLAASAAVALVVFEKLGVGLLRKAWFNLDLVWAVALVVTSIVTVVMA
jgi:hypothetical protein